MTEGGRSVVMDELRIETAAVTDENTLSIAKNVPLCRLATPVGLQVRKQAPLLLVKGAREQLHLRVG